MSSSFSWYLECFIGELAYFRQGMALLANLPPLILGSKSPRRQSLLAEAGFEFTFRTDDADESFSPLLKGGEIPAYLASFKSDAISIQDDECLITADTVVCMDDEVLNKPADFQEAKAMVTLLSGKFHWVHTGVCLRQSGRKHVFVESTKVVFRELEEEEIDYYITNYQPYDKAGSYGIQEWIGYRGVERIEGCYPNVVGFPVARFVNELAGFLAE